MLFRPYCLDDVIPFFQEREQVRILKEEKNQPWPWTSDEILQSEKFCNINRNDDRQTIRFFEAVRSKDWSESDIIYLAMVFRFSASVPSTIDLFMEHDSIEMILNEILNPNYHGNFNNSRIKRMAYQSPPIKKEFYQSLNLRYYPYLCKTFYENLDTYSTYLLNPINKEKSLMELTKGLSSLLGFNVNLYFHCSQVVSDLSEVLPEYFDKNSFCFFGSGSRTCIKKISPRIKKLDIKSYIDLNFPGTKYNYLEFEHGLCEYNKYSKYALSQKPRKYYYLEV
jgi:hypothetical protein